MDMDTLTLILVGLIGVAVGLGFLKSATVASVIGWAVAVVALVLIIVGFAG